MKNKFFSSIIALAFISSSYTAYRMFVSIEQELQSKVDKMQEETMFLEAEIRKKESEIAHLLQKEESAYLDLKLLVNELANTKNVTIQQGYNVQQLKNIILAVMDYLGEVDRQDYTALLLLTAQVESDLGHYSRQVNGPARGIFQIEKTTEQDVLKIFLPRDKKLQAKIEAISSNTIAGVSQLESNIIYSICITYCVYKWRLKGARPPDKSDKLGQAEVHKKLYNTVYGDATVLNSLLKGSGV